MVAPYLPLHSERFTPLPYNWRNRMSGTTDKIKGRVKEAVGALTNDKELKNEGKADQASGAVKDSLEKAIDKVKDVASKK